MIATIAKVKAEIKITVVVKDVILFVFVRMYNPNAAMISSPAKTEADFVKTAKSKTKAALIQ